MVKGPGIDFVLSLSSLLTPRLAVIFIGRESKIPALKWKRVINGELFSDAELAAGWRDDFNPGLATGQASQLIVVDCDNQAAIDWCLANIPLTRMAVVTREDGRHLYYNAPPHAVKNAIDVLGSKQKFVAEAAELGLDLVLHHLEDQSPEAFATERERHDAAWAAAREKLVMGPVIDIRGDGGQVVAPGSVRADGRQYMMVEPWSQEIRDSIPTYDPAWFEGRRWKRPGARVIGDLVAKRRERELEGARDVSVDAKLKRARAWLAKVEGAVAGAGGHNKTFYAAARLAVGFDLDSETVYDLLLHEYNPRCQPPWSDVEIAHKVVDACRLKGPDSGYMLVDRRPKVIENAVYVNDLPEPETEPPPPAPAGDQQPDDELNESERAFAARIDRQFGIDYREIRRAGAYMGTVPQPNGSMKIPPTLINFRIVLEYSRALADLRPIRWNNLKMRVETGGEEFNDRVWLSSVSTRLGGMWGQWPSDISRKTIREAIDSLAYGNAYEPVQEWLLSLPPWDGVPRLETAPRRVLRSPSDRPVVGVMFRHFLTSIVARTMNPGAKVDTLTILVGPQGAFKGQFFQLLIDGDLNAPRWYTCQNFRLDDRDGQMVYSSHVIVEWSEGEHAKSAKSIDMVKAFLSKQNEDFRRPYATNPDKVQRRCVFVASSNDTEIIHDATGDRRFYIVPVGDIDTQAVVAERLQWFAEALALYRRFQAAGVGDGEWNATRWWFTRDEDVERQALAADYRARSVWFEDIENWVRERGDRPFTVGDVFEQCLDMDKDRRRKTDEREILSVLRQMGCENMGHRRYDGRDGRYWRQAPGTLVDIPPLE